LCEVETDNEEKDPDIKVRNPSDVKGQYICSDAGEEDSCEDVDGRAHLDLGAVVSVTVVLVLPVQFS
jgi:hypothetical protein